MSSPGPSPSPSPACWDGFPFTLPMILDPAKFGFMSFLPCAWEQWGVLFLISFICCIFMIILLSGGGGAGGSAPVVVIKN